MNKNLTWVTLLWVVLGSVALLAQKEINVRYVYDEAGQMLASIDTNNSATLYGYDGAGNLVSVERLSAQGPVEIFILDPNRGRPARPPQPGTPVAIHGLGFSAVPAENQVTFKGVPAVVEAASETLIRTRVPAGARSGPVQVTTPAGTARSRKDFLIVEITVSPARVDLLRGQRQQFTATLRSADAVITGEVVWSVNGILGGNRSVGTIDDDGLYTAPTETTAFAVTVEAAIDELAVSGTARAVIMPPNLAFTSLSYGIARSDRITLAPVFSALSYTAVTISGLSPDRASRGAVDVAFTITGRDFRNLTALVFLGPGGVADSRITVSNVTVSPDGTRITGRLTVAADAALGPRTVVIQTAVGPSTSAPTAGNQFFVE